MQIPILVQGYPSAQKRSNMAFVHSRNLYYQSKGLEPIVLNFGTQEDGDWEGIPVLSEASFLQRFQRKTWPLLISHAPNLRNHLRFLYRYQSLFKHQILIIHGHEVLIKHRYYPKPYFYQEQGWLYQIKHQLYDQVKVRVFKRYIEAQARQHRLDLIFVSQFLNALFKNNVQADGQLIDPCSHIIPNGVGPLFIHNRYHPQRPQADFITVRSLDQPSYAIDLVLTLARQFPELRFGVYGQGSYFKHDPPPANLSWHNKSLSHNEMMEILPSYRCALMPTRHDSQGVMSCELASYGIPLITSDITVAREVLGGFPQVVFGDNQRPASWDLTGWLDAFQKLDYPLEIDSPYTPERTVAREFALIQKYL